MNKKILSKKEIQELNFGKPAAERDLHAGLMEYFHETESYKRISKGDKTVLLGNRGSGKSAIFKVLGEQLKKEGKTVIEILPEDYSYEMLDDAILKEKEGNWIKQGSYAAAWKYVIYITAMKKIQESYPTLLRSEGKDIFNYLRDNHKSSGKLTKLDYLISYLKRIEGVKIGGYEAGLKTRELQQLYKLEEINSLLPSLNRICSKKKIVFFIDELDKGWDNSEDAKAFVSGLFQASLSINQTVPSIKVFVSLRKELYDNIPSLYEDSQKVWDLFELIEWDEKNLLEMISKRIEKSGDFRSMEREVTSKDFWNLVFEDTIAYRSTKSFNYIVDRTLYRPREIIQFCTDIKDNLTSDSSIPVNYDTISVAEYRYSESRTKDIAAEYRYQYVDLLKVFESFRGGPYNFSRDELELKSIELILGEGEYSNMPQWLQNQDPDYLINILWQIGFIRAQAVGGVRARRRSGSSYLGSHQISHLNLKGMKNFHIHPMFRLYLGLKEKK